MKDLDFDELDRAVNTLMNDVSKTDAPDDTDDQTKTLSITPTLPESAPAPVVLAAPAASDVHVRTSAPVSPPLAARRGRFMDVVHSSSDMKKDKATSGLISRQGVTLTPSKSATEEANKLAPAQSTMPTPDPVPAAVFQPVEPTTEPVSHSSDWPDPLELSGFKPDSSEEPATQPQPEPTPLLEEGSETPAVAPASDDIQPLSTPFLTDAKVEKRPLGSPMISAPEEAPEPDHTPVVSTSDTSLTVDDPSDQLAPPVPDEPKKELPPELQGDLVAIESGSSSENIIKPVETITEKHVDMLQPSSHPTALLEAKTDDEPAFTGPTSIAQQYKEEPNTGDQKNGAIYDTDAYHKPLAHPAKKKSGWLWVVWIILILLIGAGAGAALYFSGIF